APIFHQGRLAEDERLDLPGLAAALAPRGVPATPCSSTAEVLETALAEAREGDVVVTMSSGSFEGLPRRLAAELAARVGTTVSASPA
ncbi:MAG TPA: hypothetical protein VEG34_03405, partial [Thermoanaerobaculia bacterium]|nr:hypothetical protein [Thermoanaerobaculia bacterium]